MNEAFNLYITITYAAHQAGPVTEAAPQWRFYLIGWGLPVVIVTTSGCPARIAASRFLYQLNKTSFHGILYNFNYLF